MSYVLSCHPLRLDENERQESYYFMCRKKHVWHTFGVTPATCPTCSERSVYHYYTDLDDPNANPEVEDGIQTSVGSDRGTIEP